MSAIYLLPAASMAMAEGFQKLAIVAGPSLEPASPEPANTATSPAGVTERITLFSKSATYTTPAASVARPWGDLNLAFVPSPLTKPCVCIALPARMTHAGADVKLLMRRMFWFKASAMYRTLPLGSSASPVGREFASGPRRVRTAAVVVFTERRRPFS